MKGQEQVELFGEEKQPVDMDEMNKQPKEVHMEPSEHARKVVLEKDSMGRTRKEPVCRVENKLTLVKEGVRKDSQAMGGSKELVVDGDGGIEGGRRLAPNVQKKIAELRRVAVGGSTEKEKRGRGKKKLPELPDCFPRIDVIISAMGGKKVKRKREEIDDEED